MSKMFLKGTDGRTYVVETPLTPSVDVHDIDGGHRVTITDNNGEKTVDILNGTSVTIKSVLESTIDGGNNIVEFSDGKTVTIRNGSKGADGKDYVLTEADKAEIAGMVGDIASGGTTTVLEWQDIAVDFSQYPNKYVYWTAGLNTAIKIVDAGTGFGYARIPVSAGDKFKTCGRIYYNAPVWVVANESGTVLQMGTKGSVVETSEDEFTISAGGAYLYINKNDQNNNGTGFQYLKKEVETTVEVPMPVYLSPLYNKKIVYDGDSICLGAFGGGGYAKIIANTVMGAYDNQAKGGARLTAKGDNTYHSVVDNLGNLPADGDLYCFEGGINDFWTPKTLGTYSKTDFAGTLDTGTVCGALETIFRYALSNFVGKPICFVITHKIQSTAYVKNANGDTFEDYRNAMVGICQKYSIAYYDAFSESGLNGWNTAQNSAYLTGNTDGTADGCHPNEEGYKRYYVPQLIRLFEGIMPVS